MMDANGKTSDEFARVVWASHILSYLRPGALITENEQWSSSRQPTVQDMYDDGDEELDDDPDIEQASVINQTLTAGDEIIREKFLNCISELVARKKGGRYVTAAALREKENSVEVDLARNSEFGAIDDDYLSSMTKFLAIGAEDISSQEVVNCYHSFLDKTIDYNSDREDYLIEKIASMLKGSRCRNNATLFKEKITKMQVVFWGDAPRRL